MPTTFSHADGHRVVILVFAYALLVAFGASPAMAVEIGGGSVGMALSTPQSMEWNWVDRLSMFFLFSFILALPHYLLAVSPKMWVGNEASDGNGFSSPDWSSMNNTWRSAVFLSAWGPYAFLFAAESLYEGFSSLATGVRWNESHLIPMYRSPMNLEQVHLEMFSNAAFLIGLALCASILTRLLFRKAFGAAGAEASGDGAPASHLQLDNHVDSRIRQRLGILLWCNTLLVGVLVGLLLHAG